MNEREERQIFDAKKIADEIDALRNNDQEYDFICNITSYHLWLFAEGLRSLAIAQAPTDCGAWMPIETAPKVARESVLVARFGTKAIRAYQQPVGTWRMHGDWNADLSGPYAPNVWMPCPEGPALPSTDRGGK